MDATNILRPKMKTDASSNNSTGFPFIKYTRAQQSIQTREKKKETWNDHYSKYKLPSLITGTSSEQVIGTGIRCSGELAT